MNTAFQRPPPKGALSDHHQCGNQAKDDRPHDWTAADKEVENYIGKESIHGPFT
jgi:hypothetical protein